MTRTQENRRSFWSVTRKLLAVAGVIVTAGFMAEAGTLLAGQHKTKNADGSKRDGPDEARNHAAALIPSAPAMSGSRKSEALSGPPSVNR